MHKYFLVLFIIVLILVGSQQQSFAITRSSEVNYENTTQMGDVGVWGLNLAAFGISVGHHDFVGASQHLAGLGITVGITEYSKANISESRPDNSDNHSFPSGHASAAFAASSYLQHRYGWEWGLPAHIIAAGVAWTRVYTENHYTHDVIAGAALGYGVSWLVTSKYDQGWKFIPRWERSKDQGYNIGLIAVKSF